MQLIIKGGKEMKPEIPGGWEEGEYYSFRKDFDNGTVAEFTVIGAEAEGHYRLEGKFSWPKKLTGAGEIEVSTGTLWGYQPQYDHKPTMDEAIPIMKGIDTVVTGGEISGPESAPAVNATMKNLFNGMGLNIQQTGNEDDH